MTNFTFMTIGGELSFLSFYSFYMISKYIIKIKIKWSCSLPLLPLSLFLFHQKSKKTATGLLSSNAQLTSIKLINSVKKLLNKKERISLLTLSAWNIWLRLRKIVGHVFATLLKKKTGKSRDVQLISHNNDSVHLISYLIFQSNMLKISNKSTVINKKYMQLFNFR